MNQETLLWLFLGSLGVNLGILLWILTKGRRNVMKAKRSRLNQNLTKIIEDFKNKVKVSYKADGRIYIDLPEKVDSADLFMYLEEVPNGILITENGEVLKRMNMMRTLNKSAIHSICDIFKVNYNTRQNTLEMTVKETELKDAMWSFLFALVAIEYARY